MITPSSISIILHKIRKPNSLIVNYPKNVFRALNVCLDLSSPSEHLLSQCIILHEETCKLQKSN